MEQLIYHTSPVVTLATNEFVNVPVILQFDDTPLVQIVTEQGLGFTTQIPIYHQDGTYLAKVRGNRVHRTPDGEKAGIEVRRLADVTVCRLDGRTLFELKHQPGDAFRLSAELHTPTGFFVMASDAPGHVVLDTAGNALKANGLTMSESHIEGADIGVWLRSDGSFSVGCYGVANRAPAVA